MTDEILASLEQSICASNQSLLSRFPIDAYIKRLDGLETCGGYRNFTPETETWCQEIATQVGQETLENYHKLVLVTLISRFTERTKVKLYPESVRSFFFKYFCNVISMLDKNPKGFYLHCNDLFAKDLGVCRQKLIPCGAQLIDANSGLSRRAVLRGGLRQMLELPLFIAKRVGGLKPRYQMHMDTRLVLEFNPTGWESCYRRIGKLLELNREIRGVRLKLVVRPSGIGG